MDEHLKLKTICDKIGYSLFENWLDWDWYNHYFWKELRWWVWCIPWFKRYNVREIIFTKEFMDKFIEYTNNKDELWENFRYLLLYNLDDPVECLFNLIK